MNQEAMSYPVGRFAPRAQLGAQERSALIDEIAALPAAVRAAVASLDDAQLDTPYREGGWTVRQVVHHLPDSHMNGFVRFKLALTEDVPTIKPYDQDAWSKLADTRLPIEVSLRLLDAVHERWVAVLRATTSEQWQRRFMHPENGMMTLDTHLQNYAWHGRHHLAHITNAKTRHGG